MNATAAILAALCIVQLLLNVVIVRNRFQLRTLARETAPDPGRWPSVSVVIPARDEAQTIGPALTSRLAEAYPDVEYIVVDDRSSDATGAILAEIAAHDPRVHSVRVDTLPDGWLGKVHALQTGLETASGEWLLFSDADLHVEPDALRQAIAYAEDRGVDHLALVPAFRSGSFLVDSAFSMFQRLLLLIVSPAAVRDPRKATALGSGSFNLVRRCALERTGGFEWLRLETTDDMGFGLMLKRSGARCESMNGRGSASIAIYRSVPEFFRGIEKNGGATIGAPFAAIISVLVLGGVVDLAGFAALAMPVGWLRALGAVTIAVMTAVTVMTLHLNTQLWAPALAWPLGQALFVSGVARASWLVRARGGVRWRDTFYPTEMLAQGKRFWAAKAGSPELDSPPPSAQRLRKDPS